MKIGKNLMLVGVMSLVSVYLPSVAMGEDTTVDTKTAADVAPAQPTAAPVQPSAAPVQPVVAPVQPAAAPTNNADPMGAFTLTPKIGYVYLGAQGAHQFASDVLGGSASIPGTNANAMQIALDLKFGSFELEPFYMLIQPDAADADKSHGIGLYLGYLHSWRIPTAGAGVFYPGVGFGWKFGWLFASAQGVSSDYGVVSALRIPLSCTWYPSASHSIGIVLEWGLGFQMNAAIFKFNVDGKDETYGVVNYGFYTDLMAGVRFF
jgi:hypothetical protein